jgi:DNA-binding response OmpR family regulator
MMGIELEWASDDTLYQALMSTKIFLAEDDDDLRAALVDELSDYGHQVVAAPNIEALANLLETDAAFLFATRPTAVVVDLRMPGRSGLDLLRHLRNSGWKTPVVVMTAYGTTALRKEAARWPPAAVLDKPFGPGMLSKTIDGLLGL